MKKNLVNFIKRRDYAGFKENLTDENLKNLLTDEEEQILLLAPDNCLSKLLEKYQPSENGEQVLISHRAKSIVLLMITKWGLSKATVLWAITKATSREYSKVVPYIDDADMALEKAMLERNEVELLDLWLKNFGSLTDAGEKLLEERPELNALKMRYIQGTLNL